MDSPDFEDGDTSDVSMKTSTESGKDAGSSLRRAPPLGGSIPDMTSTTSFFVGLQQVYQRRATADRVVLRTTIDKLLTVSSLLNSE
jgi:hypothetical protein